MCDIIDFQVTLLSLVFFRNIELQTDLPKIKFTKPRDRDTRKCLKLSTLFVEFVKVKTSPVFMPNIIRL